MGNMSYVRFENTLEDLRDCYESMSEEVSESEEKKRERLIKLCIDIALNYGNSVGREVAEV